MSTSPKYSQARAGAARLAREAQARVERERRRAQELEKQREAALKAARAKASKRVAVIRATAEDLLRRAETLGVPVDSGGYLFGLAGVDLADAKDLDALGRCTRRLDKIERSQSRSGVAIAQHGRQNLNLQLEAVSSALNGVAAGERERFDAEGARRAQCELAELRGLAAPDLQSALSRCRTAAGLVAEHLDRVVAGRARLEQERDEAALGISQCEIRLRALEEDAVQARVPLHGWKIATEALQLFREQQAAEEFPAVIAACVGMQQRLAEIEAELDHSIDRVTQRRELLNTIVADLPRLGLTPDPSSLVETADGGIGICASRASGDLMSFVVESSDDGEHRILYMSGEMQSREGTPGAASDATCHSVRGLAELVNDQVRRNGFAVGDVRWDDRDGPRPPNSAGAASRPGSPSVRRRELS